MAKPIKSGEQTTALGTPQAEKPASDSPPVIEGKDVAMVVGQSENGVAILRRKDDQWSAGELRPLKHAEAITGEVVKLAQREDSPALFDVDVVYAPKKQTPGPSKVSSKKYRKGWNRVFKGSSTVH